MIKKPSFLERITGSVKVDTSLHDDFDQPQDIHPDHNQMYNTDTNNPQWDGDETEQEGELPIDMYQTRDTIVIRALVAGVNPEDLNISITRDMVTLKGQREEIQEVPDEDYFHRELFWGSFSRSIVLPEEIIIDEAEAREKHGFLEIILPKLDKGRSAKLSVKSHHAK